MSNQSPQLPEEQTVVMNNEAVRQQIVTQEIQREARSVAAENAVLRNRVSQGSNGAVHIVGFVLALAAIATAIFFFANAAQNTRQQAEASRQDAQASRMEAQAANSRANSALDAAYRSGQRAQAANAAAQQATNRAIQAEQNAQKPVIIVNPPPPGPAPAVIVPPAETAPAPVTEVPSSPEKPLEGKIE